MKPVIIINDVDTEIETPLRQINLRTPNYYSLTTKNSPKSQISPGSPMN